jgi:Na+/H+ antiporter NhaD/arsenite permease-like protein
LMSLVVPLMLATFQVKKQINTVENQPASRKPLSFEQRLIFFVGIGVLLFIPIFKTITHLPPFMGMLLGLGILWILIELLHRKKNFEEKHKFSVIRALERMDVPSVLFFLGILLAVGALQNAGLLTQIAAGLSSFFSNDKAIAATIGIFSAIVDNVPIVGATIAMYPIDIYPPDHSFWHLLAFCAGAGGSLLIIGSAAGIAAMGLENISFGWYLKKISWLAALGYLAGIGVFILQETFL